VRGGHNEPSPERNRLSEYLERKLRSEGYAQCAGRNLPFYVRGAMYSDSLVRERSLLVRQAGALVG